MTTTNDAEPLSAELERRIVALLGIAGIPSCGLSISTCSKGANNRTYRIETADGVFAAKEYFRHADDSRNRLFAETEFLKYANAKSPGRTPQLLASDAQAGLALLELVDGCPLTAGAVGKAHVESAIAFFRDLNLASSRLDAELPVAAEAAFSIVDQLKLIDARLGQLLSIEPHSTIDSAALEFARRLREVWTPLDADIRQDTMSEAIDDGAQHRCISPSDFGFHNSMVTTAGQVRFIDFEYAGWDDSAKTFGDFFAQLAVPVPIDYFDQFVLRCTNVLPEPAVAARRARLMRPAYQVKWCCIALNVFLPVHLARRKFANPGLNENALKVGQIEKAERLMASIVKDSR